MFSQPTQVPAQNKLLSRQLKRENDYGRLDLFNHFLKHYFISHFYRVGREKITFQKLEILFRVYFINMNFINSTVLFK